MNIHSDLLSWNRCTWLPLGRKGVECYCRTKLNSLRQNALIWFSFYVFIRLNENSFSSADGVRMTEHTIASCFFWCSHFVSGEHFSLAQSSHHIYSSDRNWCVRQHPNGSGKNTRMCSCLTHPHSPQLSHTVYAWQANKHYYTPSNENFCFAPSALRMR